METIQVVIDEDLLRAADRTARRLKLNRSALFRAALREHLRRIRSAGRERLDREGYERHRDHTDDLGAWDKVASWPED